MKLEMRITLDDVLKTVMETEGGLINELKAQAFEEFIEEAIEECNLDFYYDQYTAQDFIFKLQEHIKRLRGEK